MLKQCYSAVLRRCFVFQKDRVVARKACFQVGNQVVDVFKTNVEANQCTFKIWISDGTQAVKTLWFIG